MGLKYGQAYVVRSELKKIGGTCAKEKLERMPAFFQRRQEFGSNVAGTQDAKGLHLLRQILQRRQVPSQPMVCGDLFRKRSSEKKKL